MISISTRASFGKRATCTVDLPRPGPTAVTLTDGDEQVTFAWLAEQLRTFVDLNPEFETPVERLATWLARLDDDDDD